MDPLDTSWLRAHPLPPIVSGDKNARGRVLVVGGAEFVPGALRLTGEAALRAGSGKLQLATVRGAAMALAVLVPEAAMIALPADDQGEIAFEAAALLTERLGRCDTLVLGPGMSASKRTERLVAAILKEAGPDTRIILDAAAMTCAKKLEELVSSRNGNVVMTPHYQEMSYLTGQDVEMIAANPSLAASTVADQFNSVVVLKGVQTIIACPGHPSLLFAGGSPGLATGGSGDVLAGVIGGIAARGTDALTAAGWGVYVHGAAGEKAAVKIATIGFLARDLLPLLPGLIEELVATVSDPSCQN
ncbi:MAG: NAD(P)H-hydrate dehydratase [Oxalobacteraceae bacterium]|nr:MAG: NAD(P)H-hydrate dehydratase [Oxalobacteraceae bacterium]